MSEGFGRKAERRNTKLRAAVTGPTGAGKTLSSLLIARGLAGDDGVVALIDTEQGSSEIYADKVDFAVEELPENKRNPREYAALIRKAGQAGVDVLVVDSLTHGWLAALEKKDTVSARSGENSYTSWRHVNPDLNDMMDAILNYPGHILCTMRSKMQHEITDGPGGKKKIQRVGMSPIMREGIEYEFTIVIDIDSNHVGFVSKSRFSELADRVVERPGESFGRDIIEALESGTDEKPPVTDDQILAKINEFAKRDKEDFVTFMEAHGIDYKGKKPSELVPAIRELVESDEF